MALSECNPLTDESGRELAVHGTADFPIACYDDDFRYMDVPWHWHEELEAVLITQGSCTVAAGSEKYFLSAGEGFFINTGVLHGCWDDAASGCRFHSLVFHPRLVGGSPESVFYRRYLLPLLGQPALEMVPLRPSVPWQKQALESIETAWQDILSGADGYEFTVRANLSQMIYQLWSHLPVLHRQHSEKICRDTARIKAMLSCIHDHFAENLSTDRIAAAAMIGKSECLRCFRSTIGVTPIQYLKAYRIRQACRCLTDTPMKISEIAVSCGFQDISYFTKTFRQIIGCTPSDYRDRKLQKETPA